MLAASGNKRDLMDKLSPDKQKADEEIAQLNDAKAKAQGQSDATAGDGGSRVWWNVFKF